MSDNRIYFSHAYTKMLDEHGEPVKTARLLLVLTLSQEELNAAKDFYNYDTDNGKYTIGFSQYFVVLLFQKPNGDLFTTVRPRHNPKAWAFNSKHKDKEDYYKSLIGQEFNIIIKGVANG